MESVLPNCDFAAILCLLRLEVRVAIRDGLATRATTGR